MGPYPSPARARAKTIEKVGYAGLLVLLLVSYVFVVSAPEGVEGGAVMFVVAVVALALVGVGKRARLYLGGWAGIAVVIVVAVGLAGGLSVAGIDGASDIVAALLFVAAAAATLERLWTLPEVTVDTVLAALSIYLLLAFAFASGFAALQNVSGEAFFEGGQFGDRSDFLYFSVVTLTTLGYGDFVADASLGRGLSALEALVGQLFLGTVVARFVGLLRFAPRSP